MHVEMVGDDRQGVMSLKMTEHGVVAVAAVPLESELKSDGN